LFENKFKIFNIDSLDLLKFSSDIKKNIAFYRIYIRNSLK
jgi:hypothetical protein